eukprot:8747299-Pyramimonas_sp.AAC.1
MLPNTLENIFKVIFVFSRCCASGRLRLCSVRFNVIRNLFLHDVDVINETTLCVDELSKNKGYQTGIRVYISIRTTFSTFHRCAAARRAAIAGPSDAAPPLLGAQPNNEVRQFGRGRSPTEVSDRVS